MFFALGFGQLGGWEISDVRVAVVGSAKYIILYGSPPDLGFFGHLGGLRGELAGRRGPCGWEGGEAVPSGAWCALGPAPSSFFPPSSAASSASSRAGEG